VLLLGLAAGCQGKAQPVVPEFYSTAVPVAPGASSGAAATATPVPTVEYVISDLPLPQGLEKLSSPIKFEWPDIETVLQKLEDYNWDTIAARCLRQRWRRSSTRGWSSLPYNWEEQHWTDNDLGSVGLYYHSVFRVWIYVWMLPGPDEKSTPTGHRTQRPGTAMGWECRLSPPAETVFLAYSPEPILSWRSMR